MFVVDAAFSADRCRDNMAYQIVTLFRTHYYIRGLNLAGWISSRKLRQFEV